MLIWQMFSVSHCHLEIPQNPNDSPSVQNANIHFIIISDIDEKLDKRDLHLVKISDDSAGEEYGIEELPSLVYFENGVPEIFEG